MASKAFLLAIIIATIFASQAFATDYVVGDDAGWRLGVNYTAWAEGKEFYVGDRLIFNYTKGSHNIYKVNGTDFQQCNVPPPSEALTTGNDIITLTTPGRKWYICGVGQHCANGMKLVITVYSAMAPYSPIAQAPAPTFGGAVPLKPISSSAPAPAPAPTYGAAVMPAKKSMSFWSNWKLKIHF